MDVALAFKYVCESNPVIYETFYGIPILKTQVSEEMKELWLEAYQWKETRHNVAGMLTGY